MSNYTHTISQAKKASKKAQSIELYRFTGRSYISADFINSENIKSLDDDLIDSLPDNFPCDFELMGEKYYGETVYSCVCENVDFAMWYGDKKAKVLVVIIPNLPTYDVHFDDDTDSSSKGWEDTYDECMEYIRHYNGTNESYFEDYKGGTVSIVCNETEETVYEEMIR